jgi:hypothetical protein
VSALEDVTDAPVAGVEALRVAATHVPGCANVTVSRLRQSARSQTGRPDPIGPHRPTMGTGEGPPVRWTVLGASSILIPLSLAFPCTQETPVAKRVTQGARSPSRLAGRDVPNSDA